MPNGTDDTTTRHSDDDDRAVNARAVATDSGAAERAASGGADANGPGQAPEATEDGQATEDACAAARPTTGEDHPSHPDATDPSPRDERAVGREAATADDGTPDGVGPAGVRRLRLPGSRRGKALLAVVLAVLLGAGAGGAVWLRATSLPDDAAFAYGDRIVTVAELDDRASALRALYGVEPPSEPAQLDTFRRDLAKSVAVSLILDRASADREIVVADKQARDVLDRFIAEQYAGDRDAFIRTLGDLGTSEREVIDEIKRQLAVARLMDDVVGDVSIGDEQLLMAFENRREQLGAPERRVLRNIVVASESEARAVLDEIRGGAPFEDAAGRHSLDQSTKQTGGMLGEVARWQLESPVGDAAFGTPEGQLYGPVQGQHGWNVGRVERILPPVPASFDQVRDQLREVLQAEVAVQRWREWLAGQVVGAEVRYSDDYRPTNPDAAPTPGGPVPDGSP